MHSTNDILQPVTATHAPALSGRIAVPGDKSISHRALMLAGQALGTTTIQGLLEGEDVLRTAEAMKACGVPVTCEAHGDWVVKGLGVGGLHAPSQVLDMGNAGTAARLLMGLLSTYPYRIAFTGDESLQKRPMMRVITPLSAMGAQFETREGGRLPLTMTGSDSPLPIRYTLPVASAQVKSAVMLAGLNTPGVTTVIEQEPTRDHTERMLRFFGVPIDVQHTDEGTAIHVSGQPSQTYADRTLTVPGDPSSAAFPIVAALLVPGSDITVTNVCLNPLRTGLFDVLKHMGAALTIENPREVGGEPVGDIRARYSLLKAANTVAAIAPSMIDEYPILAVACAFAEGTSIMRGLSELRVKESDRLAAIIAGLTANGVNARAEGDDLIVEGTSSPIGGGTVTTHFDHRIAMSFYVMGLAAPKPVTVDDTRAIATSFPNFMQLMQTLGVPHVA